MSHFKATFIKIITIMYNCLDCLEIIALMALNKATASIYLIKVCIEIASLQSFKQQVLGNDGNQT